ncbi:MAG TPA: lycopene cyclase family protein [Flavobacterium sp.]|jgi:lycopene beta-cyclase|nr:lycopene cyclase family protein [Flavobacterium sp.]
MTETHYDYIIAGAGCSGLSLAMRIIESDLLRGKKILIVDESPKKVNDRTWCFWETEDGFFQQLVHKQWKNLHFSDEHGTLHLDIVPYQYKLIKGIDFYNFCMTQIAAYPNITFLQKKIDDVSPGGQIVAGDNTYSAQLIFNSIFLKPKVAKKQIWLSQHFKGWYIKSSTSAFDPEAATLMDFSISQSSGTAFFYVLPFSPTEALVEYTLFSENLLQDDEYDAALRQYISHNLKIHSYTITESEFGVIPMTNASFPLTNGNIINIGTAGGKTKGSSGYTFQFIQKHSAEIVANLEQQLHPACAQTAARFSFYDSVLLDVLHQQRMQGREVFSKLFRKNKAAKVLQFLDNESTFLQEFQLISSLPIVPFAKSAWSQLKK